MNELDFAGKQVLVIGGSSGIGNGIARAFAMRDAKVCVTGTRAHSTDYSEEDGSSFEGLDYHQLDVAQPSAIDAFAPPFKSDDELAAMTEGEFKKEMDAWTLRAQSGEFIV